MGILSTAECGMPFFQNLKRIRIWLKRNNWPEKMGGEYLLCVLSNIRSHVEHAIHFKFIQKALQLILFDQCPA
jgi:hypothetical protein